MLVSFLDKSPESETSRAYPNSSPLNRDSTTPDGDQVISKHPHSEGLYIIAGGSFHSWKFLPTIGKYVVQMLDGSLEPELAQQWAWDRDRNNSDLDFMWPEREMKDV